MKIGILGAGLSGISAAYFLQDNKEVTTIEILEKEREAGGLCRSFTLGGVPYDIGPHIIFSKNKKILELMLEMLGTNVNRFRRSNKIFYKGKFVKYPFENELSALPQEDRLYCLSSFLDNPYENYKPQNMLQFFLTTFGEGITNTYLRPYNEKIWKFDPTYMDTQMVERIPKPPAEDIIKSANGVPTEGYLHQLYFYYPKNGGMVTLVKAIASKLNSKVRTTLDFNITRITRHNNQWVVEDGKGRERIYDLIISTIPLPVLARAWENTLPANVRDAVNSLKYNSIVICVLNLKNDNLGDNLAIMVPDKEILFHRLTKLNFLMKDSPATDGLTVLMAEVTYKKGDSIDRMSNADIKSRVLSDLTELGFIDTDHHCDLSDTKRFEYAYVIQDLNHRKNTNLIKDFCENQPGIILHGRFGRFEYINMDTAIQNSRELNKSLKWKR